MSVITIQLGQCGNQIGKQFFDTIVADAYSKYPEMKKSVNEDYVQRVLDRFFIEREKPFCLQARALLIDTEQKVVSQTFAETKNSKLWQFNKNQILCHKRGSGNNWALGFCEYGSQDKNSVIDLIQKEAEQCDHLSGFLIMMSLAGGTGSGVGAAITEAINDCFPHTSIINQVIWPYSSGEVIVQNYNAVLCLSRLYQYSDAILVLENDKLNNICSKLLNMKQVSFTNINQLISHQLASVFQPALTLHNNNTHLGDLIQQLVPHSDYKLLGLQNIPQLSQNVLDFSSYSWTGILKHLRQMLIAKTVLEEGIDWKIKADSSNPYYLKHNKSIANLLVLRGKEVDQADFKAFNEPQLYSSWIPENYNCAVWHHHRPFNRFEKLASLVSNSQQFTEILNNVVTKAWTMFSTRAYVHQYLKHCLTEDDFMDSFASLEQIVKNYREI